MYVPITSSALIHAFLAFVLWFMAICHTSYLYYSFAVAGRFPEWISRFWYSFVHCVHTLAGF